jgi:hypothetical protein
MRTKIDPIKGRFHMKRGLRRKTNILEDKFDVYLGDEKVMSNQSFSESSDVYETNIKNIDEAMYKMKFKTPKEVKMTSEYIKKFKTNLVDIVIDDTLTFRGIPVVVDEAVDNFELVY